MSLSLTVVIASYNRPDLVKRAIASAVTQADAVVVVNDGSVVAYDLSAELAAYGNLSYIALDQNSGVQFARNAGLDATKTDLALVLDDDDTLRKGAVDDIKQTLNAFADFDRYPVFNFATSNAALDASHKIISHLDYINQSLRGDYTPIFNLLHSAKPRYPVRHHRAGMEHMLWWVLAAEFGIPTWREIAAVDVGAEALQRMTAPQTFVTKSADFASMQIETMQLMKSRGWHNTAPKAYRTRVHAALLFALAAGNKSAAREAANELSAPYRVFAKPIAMFPAPIAQKVLYSIKRFALRKSHKA